MERDFMGLNSKDSVMAVKEEAVENCRDSAFSKASAAQWPSSNKISALPHFMSFKVAQEEKMGKNVSDPLASSGFMISSVDVFDATQKRQSGENQVLPVSNQAVSVSMANHPFFKTHFIGASQNFGGALPKQQLIGGVPVIAPQSILASNSPIGGATEPWINTKVSGAPAQLTIFYNGTVNVYDDISPEKAQAIMFLAGNGSSVVSNMAQQQAQIQPPTSKLAAGDGVLVNQPVNTPPGSGLSSPLSVSSHPVGQSGGRSTGKDDAVTAKTLGIATAPVGKVDSPKIVTSRGPIAATTMSPSAVPQYRKASLARFLEKRKERQMDLAPYNCNESPECSNPESNGIKFSKSSAVGSGSVSTGKEAGHDV